MKQLIQRRYASMAGKLKSSGLKATPQRLAIMRELVKSDEHPSVDVVWRRLRRRFPGISQATVYRTIMLLKSLGEAYEIAFADGGSRYDGLKPYPHPHIVCLACGRIIDPDAASLEETARAMAAASGFEITSFRLDFFGTCPACLKKKKLLSDKKEET